MNIAGNAGRVLALALLAAAVLCGCRQAPPQALGTLEYDRITLPAPVAERIVSIDVHEGERVAAGQTLLQLNPAQTRAGLLAAEAQVQQQRDALAQLVNGPRAGDITQARANLAAAAAQARQTRAYYQRLQALKTHDYVSTDELGRARAAAGSADGQAAAARALFDQLLHGTRPEQIAQGRAALAAALAQAAAQRVLLGKLHVVAPRAGLVDSLPYRLGDQAPVGAPLAILLVGAAPYARIYVPEPERANVHVGDSLQVFVAGRDKPYPGTVRMLRSEPAFTPYYALIGADAARLSYLAEVTLGTGAANLPAGLPVRVEWAGSGR